MALTLTLASPMEILSNMIVGVLSDTHGLLRPEVTAALRGSDIILHAGDVGKADIIDQLGGLAPVVAIRGNVDNDAWVLRLPATEVVELGDALVYIIHDINDLAIDPVAAGMHAVLSGHSHVPLSERRDGMLYLNPGSAGPRRFKRPVCVARLTVDGTTIVPAIQELSV